MSATAVILAAGYGSRMRSALPKALHPIAGRPMLCHLLDSVTQVFDRVVVVVGPDMNALVDAAAPHTVVVQSERLGTAHAALQAGRSFGDGVVAVLYADNPLIGPQTLARLVAARPEGGLSLLAMRPADTGRYGRVIADGDGLVERIVEHADASAAEREIGLCNAGVFCAEAQALRGWLAAVTPSPSSGEYYLTEVVPMAARAIAVEAPFNELRGINTRAELAEAEAEVQHALRSQAMAAGVTMAAPETVRLSFDTRFGQDCTIEPSVVFATGVTIGQGVTIRGFSHLEGCTVQDGAVVGPFARLRPGTVMEPGSHVGNFVELKATRLGAGAKANHLSYLGDAAVGARSNIGAGTITCNYDGVSKHRTEIGADVFVGSATTLVAPALLGDGAFVAAGSVITDPVEPGALAFGRARQENKPGMGTRLKRWLSDKAASAVAAKEAG